jgi:hypothetical protein
MHRHVAKRDSLLLQSGRYAWARARRASHELSWTLTPFNSTLVDGKVYRGILEGRRAGKKFTDRIRPIDEFLKSRVPPDVRYHAPSSSDVGQPRLEMDGTGRPRLPALILQMNGTGRWTSADGRDAHLYHLTNVVAEDGGSSPGPGADQSWGAGSGGDRGLEGSRWASGPAEHGTCVEHGEVASWLEGTT